MNTATISRPASKAEQRHPHALSGGGRTPLEAAHWHESALARSLLAQCDPAAFAYVPRVSVVRDYEEWAPLTNDAEQIVKALAVLAENAVTQEFGYYWQDFDTDRVKASAWLDRHSEIPSAEEAIEIEFARRADRTARMRWRPSAEMRDAYRAVVGAGL